MVTAILAGQPAAAQEPQASSSQDKPTRDQAATGGELNLPVSLDKIREALKQPVVEPLKGLDEKPHFRVEIRARQQIEDLLATLKFNGGPAVPGGVYGYEQQRLLFPPVDNPLAQPYAAFSRGELLQVAITSLIERYLAGKLTRAVSNAEHARAVQAAKEEVRQAIVDYCAAQPRGGAGIQICESPPAIR